MSPYFGDLAEWLCEAFGQPCQMKEQLRHVRKTYGLAPVRMGQKETFVLARNTSTRLDAHMILNLLEQEGISGRVDGESIQSASDSTIREARPASGFLHFVIGRCGDNVLEIKWGSPLISNVELDAVTMGR